MLLWTSASRMESDTSAYASSMTSSFTGTDGSTRACSPASTHGSIDSSSCPGYSREACE